MLKSHELIGFMSPDLAAQILNFAYESDKPLYRVTLGAVADARKLRPVFLERQPRSQRHEAMVSSLSKPALDAVSANLIRTWLLKKNTGILTDFLDSLGIPHKEGVVEDLPEKVDPAKLKSAVETVLSKHPPEAVAVYLHAFNDMNEVDWPELKTMLETEPRLQLGG